jgi:glycosyltransferase involved in cell wall biosynthesis
LAILHATKLVEAGHNVTMFTDESLMDPTWLDALRSCMPVRDLPFGLKGHDVLRELGRFRKLLIHHHVEPLLAMRIVRKYAGRTYWYTGEVLRAIWEDQITGEDYRQFSPTVYDTAQHFYGRTCQIPLWGPLYRITVAVLKALDLATVNRYKGVIANSRYMAETAKRLYHYQGSISVVYPSSSLPVSMFRPNYGRGEYVLTVGTLSPNKNHRTLLEAFALLEQAPELRIIGDGQEESNLKAQVRQLGINATFHSNVGGDELCRLYENSLFVVVPSLSEPFGMTTLEAALAGKPSVVTRLGGAQEFVLDQQNGLVIDPRNARELASSMQMLLNDEGLRTAMGRRARERALDSFTLENSAAALSKAWIQ